MDYASKYELVCKSRAYGTTYTAKIQEGDYVGSVIDRDIPLNAFRLIKDNQNSVIKGTSFEFGIREEVDFEFVPFFTNAPKKYYIKLYNGETHIWSGFLNTQQYSAPYKPVPNTLWFTATDGLGLLKDQPFALTGWKDEFEIIRHCLSYVNAVFTLDYAIAIPIHDINHDASYSPLEQTYHNCTVFEDLSCYEVLEKILNRYDGEITQQNNSWLIRSSKDKLATRLLYDYEGTYKSTQQAPDLQYFDYPANGGNCWPVGSPLQHGLKAGGNRVKIAHNYGLRESMLRNYDFLKWAWVDDDDHSAGVDFEDWSEDDPHGTMTVYRRTDSNGTPYAYLYGNANITEDAGLAQQLSISNLTGGKFIFEVKSCPVYNTGSTGSVKMIITLITGATTYYLSTTGWTTTPTTITASQTAQSKFAIDVNWQSIKIITDEIPGDGLLSVFLLQIHGSDMSGVFFQKPKIYFLNANSYYSWEYESNLELIASFDGSSEMVALNDVNILSADAPSAVNNLLMYDNVTLYSLNATFYNSDLTTYWKFEGNDTLYTLIQIYLKLLASRNAAPRQTLTGTIKGERITFDCLIQHTYNSSRQFEIEKGEWDIYNDTWKVTLLEAPAFADKNITLSDSTTLGSFANLTVATVTPDGFTKYPSASFDTTVHIDNTGEMPGQGTINWKIVNGADVTQSSGDHASGIISASDDEDHVVAMTTPAVAGTYYVKCKMALDTEWVTSSVITVSLNVTLNHVDVIADGDELTPMSVSFEAAVVAGSGNKTIYWRVRDSALSVVDSGNQAVAMAAGTATYNLTGLNYPSGGMDYTLQIGLDGSNWDQTSNQFDSWS